MKTGEIGEHQVTTANVDNPFLIDAGYLPWGRTNQSLFDHNRDWTLGVNAQSRGRSAAAGSWHPQLKIDAHEMGSQDTYLFTNPPTMRASTRGTARLLLNAMIYGPGLGAEAPLMP